jgi:uncharacterized membrane protein
MVKQVSGEGNVSRESHEVRQGVKPILRMRDLVLAYVLAWAGMVWNAAFYVPCIFWVFYNDSKLKGLKTGSLLLSGVSEEKFNFHALHFQWLKKTFLTFVSLFAAFFVVELIARKYEVWMGIRVGDYYFSIVNLAFVWFYYRCVLGTACLFFEKNPESVLQILLRLFKKKQPS